MSIELKVLDEHKTKKVIGLIDSCNFSKAVDTMKNYSNHGYDCGFVWHYYKYKVNQEISRGEYEQSCRKINYNYKIGE